MRIKRPLWLLAILLCITLAVTGWRLIAWEPPFYQIALQTTLPSDEVRERSRKLVQQAMQLADEVRNESEFSAEFLEEEVNAWLADELERKYRAWLPSGISQPRVHLEDGRLLIACRVQLEYFSGVASTSASLFVTDDHRLAIWLESLRAGLIPLPFADLLEPTVARIQRDGTRIEWGNARGHDVLLVDLFATPDADRPGTNTETRELRTVEILPGRLKVSGIRRERPAGQVSRRPGPVH